MPNLFLITKLLITGLAAIFIIDRSKKYFTKKQGQTILKYSVSLAIWVAILIVTYSSDSMSINSLSSLLFLGLTIVFVLIFKLLNMIERLEEKITQIVRKGALKSLRKNHLVKRR